MNIITLPDDTKKLLLSTLMKLPSPYKDLENFLLDIYPIFANLPKGILKEIFHFARFPDSDGVILLKNFPVDSTLPPTPMDGYPSMMKQTFVTEACLLGLSQIVGEPLGYKSEKSGQVIHDVVPVEQGGYTQSNQGYKVFLNFHNDAVYDDSGFYHVSNPDFLILFCVKSDPKGEAYTYYADARDICNKLTEHDKIILRSPLFKMNAPSTYSREQVSGQVVYSKDLPIISGSEQYPEISIAANGVKPLTNEAEKAFEHLKEICGRSDVSRKVHLQPGEVLLLNNRKGVHARTEYTATFDGHDRWLQRTYIRHSIWDIRYRWTGQNRVH
ncbi:MAG: TauD/TfdA family dioxygenase [Alphaproteobacteria bacterium]|nr:TauD/TfdA family dioxygenase [Alphaproteobacteria bacterium]